MRIALDLAGVRVLLCLCPYGAVSVGLCLFCLYGLELVRMFCCLCVMVSLIIMHVQNPERLAELRATLRERMLKSPLMDGARAARDVEAAYRSMWKNFIAGTDGKQKNFVV